MSWSKLVVILLALGVWSTVGTSDRAAAAPDVKGLTRGINITAWFRFPASRDPTKLGAYLSDQALADLRTAGFDFVRLAVDPEIVDGDAPRAVLIAAIRRVQKKGLAVIVSPHLNDWHLETNPADRDRLVAFWKTLAPALQPLDSALTLPEVVNEPVFPGDPAAWAALQHIILQAIRQALPHAKIVLTGQDWGSIAGLVALKPEDDPNVLYSFHFYDPAELTSLAAYRQDIDRTAMARLPFPADNRAGCDAVAGAAADPPTRDLMLYYCSLGWNATKIGIAIDRAVTWSRQYRVHLLAGEFGASADLNSVARSAWLRTVHDAFEARGIGWALWGYDDVMGLNVSRPPGPRPALDPAILNALRMTTRM